MQTYKHIYKTENENGKWEINEHLCDICRKESNEYNRPYPDFVLGTEYVVYKTRVVKDKLHIYIIEQIDERTKEIKQILCEHFYKDGSVKLNGTVYKNTNMVKNAHLVLTIGLFLVKK